MRLVKLFLFVLAIQVVFWISGITDVPGTAIYNLATNASTWENSSIITIITQDLAADTGTVVGSIAIGTGIVLGSDLLIVLGMLPWLLSMGKPLVTFYGMLSSAFGAEIAVIFAGSIIIIFVMSILNWWRRGE